MKDYRIILTHDGITGKNKIEGNFFPANGAWCEEDFELGISLLKYGERWYRECLARRKCDKKKIEFEINEIIGNGPKKE